MSQEERELLERIAHRLDSLEQKVERLALPPRALKPKDAARLLGCSQKTLGRMVQRREIATVVIGERDHVPMSEVVRITTVTAPTASSPRIPLKRGRKASAEKTATQQAEDFKASLRTKR